MNTYVFCLCDRERESNVQAKRKINVWHPVLLIVQCINHGVFSCLASPIQHTHACLRLTHWAVICCLEGHTRLNYYTTIFRIKPRFTPTAEKYTIVLRNLLTQCNGTMCMIIGSFLSNRKHAFHMWAHVGVFFKSMCFLFNQNGILRIYCIFECEIRRDLYFYISDVNVSDCVRL